MKPTLIIVGNGLIQNKGKQIDSYERIVRMNLFQLSGFEQHVGTRNDIICTRPSVDPRELPLIETCNEVWLAWTLSLCLKQHRTQFPAWVQLVSDKKKMVIPDATFWQPFKDSHCFKYVEKSFEKLYYYSTGFFAIYFALHLGYDVTIVGFDGATTGHYWDLSHKHHADTHDSSYETKCIQDMAEKGSIKILGEGAL